MLFASERLHHRRCDSWWLPTWMKSFIIYDLLCTCVQRNVEGWIFFLALIVQPWFFVLLLFTAHFPWDGGGHVLEIKQICDFLREKTFETFWAFQSFFFSSKRQSWSAAIERTQWFRATINCSWINFLINDGNSTTDALDSTFPIREMKLSQWGRVLPINVSSN